MNIKNYFFLVVFLVAPLIAFFLFAIFIEVRFFIYITIGLLASLIYLIPLRTRYILKKAQVSLSIEDYRERVNLLEAQMHQEQVVIDSFRQKIVNYSRLKGFTEKLSMSLYLEDTSKTISSEMGKLFGEEKTTIILYLFHSKTGELGLSASHKGQMRGNIKAKHGDIFDQWIVKTMQPLLIEDTRSDYRFDSDKVISKEARAIRSLISVPLMVGNKALGILRIDSPCENHFTTEDLRLLTTTGGISAVAIENAQLFEHVEQLAICDSLTGLYLRRYLMDRLDDAINRKVRRKSSLSFLMIDVDKFKNYNDTFGHVAGDIVLRTVSEVLTEFFKKPEYLVARYGGEEFSVLLQDCPKQKAVELAEAVREKIAQKDISLRREKTRVTVSIGVSSLPDDAQNQEDLVRQADEALYQAKENGRDQVCVS